MVLTDVEPFIARRLRQLREKAGFSRYELARRAGVGVAQVTRLEGQQRSPTVLTLARFCNALGCTLSEFFLEAPSSLAAGDELAAIRRVMAGLAEEQAKRMTRAIGDLAQSWDPKPGKKGRPSEQE